MSSEYIDMLNNTNKNLDTLDMQIKKARVSGESVLEDYFRNLRDIILTRFKDSIIELANKPDEFVKQRGEFFYD